MMAMAMVMVMDVTNRVLESKLYKETEVVFTGGITVSGGIFPIGHSIPGNHDTFLMLPTGPGTIFRLFC